MIRNVATGIAIYQDQIREFLKFEAEVISIFGKNYNQPPRMGSPYSSELERWNLKLQAMELVLDISEQESIEIRGWLLSERDLIMSTP